MGPLPVSLEKQDRLAQRMAALGVREVELAESFVRSGGHVGQNVNKVATCVQLVHLPTGLQVKCQETRQQGMNRYLARCLLLDKLEERRRAREAAIRDEAALRRRRNRRPSRAAKARMLADKAHRSARKQARRVTAD